MPADLTRVTSFVLSLLMALMLVGSLPAVAQDDDGLIVAPDRDALDEATVVRVVDGDTIRVDLDGGADDQPIRIIGVDTPETVDPGEPVACYGETASAFTSALLPAGTTVWLETDVSDTDRFDRLLRYVWLEYDSDDLKFTGMIGLDDVNDGDLVMLNQLLMTHGMAQSSSYPPDVAYQDRFVADQRTAREDSVGLWGSCSAFGVPAEGNTTTDAPVEQDVPVVVNQPAGGNCDPSYPGVCIPPISVAGDLNCGDVAPRRFQVLPPDPHGFDGDSDGVGCES